MTSPIDETTNKVVGKKEVVTIVLADGAEIDLEAPIKILAFRGYTPTPTTKLPPTINVGIFKPTKKTTYKGGDQT